MPETGSADKTVSTVGSYLREVRESKGIDLKEAADVTRIGRNYLAAIEDDEFDKLPSAAYVKGFLRAYAVYLGLSGDEVVAMLEMSRNSQQSHTSRDPEKNEQEGRRKAAPIPRRWLVPLLLLCAIVVTAYFISDKGEKTSNGPKEPAAVSPGAKVTALPAPVQPLRSSVMRHPGPAAVEGTLKTPAVAADTGTGAQQGIILRLKVNQDCWLNITIDNTVSQQYDLKAGDLIEWKGEKEFALDIGNAGGVEGEFNGKPLKPFGEAGKTAHVILKAQGA